MRTADHAAVNETVDLVKGLSGKEKGFAGLVNAVLRKAVREREKLLATIEAKPEENLPDWLQSSWSETYGFDQMRAMAATLSGEPMLDISLKPGMDKETWANKLQSDLMPTGTLRRASADVPTLPGYEAGEWWVQDMAAAVPATLFSDVSGKHVLDLCAAPGGKTMQLATMGAKVTAVDRNKNRMKRLEANLQRTGLSAKIEIADASTFNPETPADHVLLDAPCSATGTFRRNPDVLWTKGLGDVEKLTALQARILDHAFSLLPVSGTLVYCVCSLEAAEGAEQINAFLKRAPKASRLPINADELGGLAELLTPAGDLLCLPSLLPERGGMDGFFAARLTKVA